METRQGSDSIKDWPEESREAAQLVIDAYGEPHEATGSLLTWHDVGPWKRVLASRVFFQHAFPAPQFDSVESVIDYRVPPYMEKLRFQPGTDTADPDRRVLSDQDLEQAVEEGKRNERANA